LKLAMQLVSTALQKSEKKMCRSHIGYPFTIREKINTVWELRISDCGLWISNTAVLEIRYCPAPW